ncbi:glycoside hydrolase [bacterium SCSIO 12741]|nr:glycoside hydrolase [bacterium SCSIO 12741]
MKLGSKSWPWFAPVLGVFCWCFAITAQAQNTIHGVSFVSTDKPVNDSHFSHLDEISPNSISLMPYALCDTSRAALLYDQPWQWFGETEPGIRQMIELARKEQVSVMLKPQIWMRYGTYTGHYDARKKWQVFESHYLEYTLTFARLAELEQVEIFCIGTEMDRFVEARPEFWNELIKKVRAVYSGKITYAANWDNYADIPFWNQLDYVGVDAYFPLSEKANPSTSELVKLWEPWKQSMKHFSDSLDKPILFCEYGYRSRDFTAKEPWKSDRAGQVNLIAQQAAYEALYQSFWKETWMAGGYLWKWFPNHKEVGGENNNRFTPQNKPVTEVIKKWYSN